MVSRRKIIFFVVFTAILALFIFFIYSYRQKIGRVLTPFFMAVVITYLLKPLVVRLERKRISRKYSILLIYLAFSLCILGAVVFVVPQLIESIKDLINTIPEMTVTYQNKFDNIMNAVQTSDWSPDIKRIMFEEINNGIKMVQELVVDTLRKVLTGLVDTVTMLFDFVLAMVIAFYLIKDTVFFRNQILSLIPGKWRKGIIYQAKKINGVLSSFVQGQLLTGVIVGIMEIIGLSIVGVRYSLILGVIGGIANIIPYFGPIIGAVPAVAISLIQSPMKALWTALVFVIVQQLENAFISPKIIEGKLGLHPVTTIFAVLIGGQFFGILGMLLAVPVIAVLKALTHSLVEAIV